VAPKKIDLGSITKAVAGLASRAKLGSRIPHLSKRPASSPEPFSAIEDDSPVGDFLSASNAAPGMGVQGSERGRLDFRGLLESAVKRPAILVGIFVILAFLLTLAVTAVIVTAPPKASRTEAPFTEKGQALVKTWLLPPGDPLEPRMAMEREGLPAYSAEDAARLGINPDPLVAARLRDRNDEAIEDLFGTVH
jgi:hypothetical protein